MVVRGNKWQVFMVPMDRGNVWRAVCPVLVVTDCQCKSYPTWREAIAHALGTADAA